jgi:hypothetical protein
VNASIGLHFNTHRKASIEALHLCSSRHCCRRKDDDMQKGGSVLTQIRSLLKGLLVLWLLLREPFDTAATPRTSELAA